MNVCSHPEDDLRCLQGVRPPLTLSIRFENESMASVKEWCSHISAQCVCVCVGGLYDPLYQIAREKPSNAKSSVPITQAYRCATDCVYL